MMGIADFPLELFRALHSRSSNEEVKDYSYRNTDALNHSTGETLRKPSHTAVETSTDHQLNVSASPKAANRSDGPPGKDLVNVPRHMSFETAMDTGKGVGRIVGAGLKSPMDFTLGLARGFHNAPRLYGDESVRPADKITGFSSGLKAASKVIRVLNSQAKPLTPSFRDLASDFMMAYLVS